MNGDDHDPYAPFHGALVRVTDVRGVTYRGVLRKRSYMYVTLDNDLVLTRAHIIALQPVTRP